MEKVAELKEYIGVALGQDPRLRKTAGQGRLPFYIRTAYALYNGKLRDRELLFALANPGSNLTVTQIEKQMNTLRDTLGLMAVVVLNDVDAITRRRLVDKHINFIATGKQMYLPDLLMDLRENFQKPREVKRQLLPSAQVMLICKMLAPKEPLETYRLKQWAVHLGYTAMAMTQAAENLKANGLCEIHGTKEKFLHFVAERNELWRLAEPLMIDPVLKRLYVDKLPTGVKLLKAGETALAEYTNLNAGREECRAIGKGDFYDLTNKRKLDNPHQAEGNYLLEVWKYDPAAISKGGAVDEISLYLSMRHNTDERIQMALGELADRW